MLEIVKKYHLLDEVRVEEGFDFAESSARAVLIDAYEDARRRAKFKGSLEEFVDKVMRSSVFSVDRFFHKESFDFSELVTYLRDYTLAHCGKTFKGNTSRPTVRLSDLVNLVSAENSDKYTRQSLSLSPSPFG